MPNEENKLLEDEVVVKKEDLKSLMKRVQDLEKNNNVLDLEEPTAHTVRVRMFKGKPVSSLENVRATGKKDEKGNQLYDCDVFVIDNGEEMRKVTDYVDFINSCPYVDATIIREDKKKSVINQGLSEVVSIDGYKSVGSGIKVPNKVVLFETTYFVKLPNGDEITVRRPNL